MLRLLLILVALVALPPRAREPLPPQRAAALLDRKLERARRVEGAVRSRFVLAAAAAACGRIDNLYAYNLLLSQFDAVGRGVLAAAKGDGERGAGRQGADGRSARAGAECGTTLRDLRAADDGLVILSEHAAHGDTVATLP